MRFSFAKEIGPKEIVREKRGTGRDKIHTSNIRRKKIYRKK